MTHTNQFIKTVTRREVTEGKRRLIGGTNLAISRISEGFLELSLYYEVEPRNGVCISQGSIEELAAILTEIAAVMKENKG